ncbi:cadherin-7-like [Brienomyrus brachyistius]|uniref:cadherin-7-like n=1 Tax=Brienomyrus brachyistius TaxID=42636 RepID=UPI0020B3489B|nr:cadherin-7-like [Brienomyrus brachyistius]XP_048858097.1 cadherin-7-like [Brienomyrus brachyistius]XP_048858098.1 cadherin-7-like [Brienomyrus brachyistius]
MGNPTHGGLLAMLTIMLALWEVGFAGLSSSSASVAPPGDLGASWHRQKRSWVWNQFFVLEEYTGEDPLYVGKLHSDVDDGEGNVKYILSGEGAGSIFTIDENTGDIHATKRLDREEQAYYTLRAQAVDRATNRPVEPESEFIIKVQDINDNEPKFLDGPYTAGVPEMSPVGTSVVQVAATDADDPTYGNSARVVYSILEGQPYFSVEPKTGIVRTALPSMDREARDQYLLVIQAKDMVGQMGGLSGTTTVTVTLTDVNDNPPHFARKSYQFTVPESLPVASVVAKIKATDLDIGPNAEMEYRVIDGDGLAMFRVTPDKDTQEGVIALQRPLDFETKSSYTLRVEALNRHVDTRFLSMGSFSDSATVHVNVEDVDEPPVFSMPLSTMTVSEAAKMGTIVGTVSAHDPDSSNSAIRYSIDRNTDLERFFNIDALTGVISTAKLLDREVNAVHNLTIFAMESHDPSQVGKGIVLITVMDINDNAPVFAIEYETFLCETARPGQVIQTISAMDRDEPPGGHRFFFTLSPEAANNLNFTLRDNKDNTASILTKRGSFRRREQAVYWLPVLIGDSGTPSLSSTNTLSIRVCDCDPDGIAQACGAEAYTLPAGLSTGALVAILACVLTLLVLVLLIVTMRRRRKEPLILDEERDVRENIVRYDDEGGGEEDTEAFDMVALRNLNAAREHATRRDVTPDAPIFFSSRPPPYKAVHDNGIFREFIWDRLKEADVDPSAPPYDSLQTYAFEGSGSVAESLSSLESLSSDSEQNYDYLSDWGPRFKKLADMYGHSEMGDRFL